MGCPVHNSDDSADDGPDGEPEGSGRGLDRRGFLKSALLIGGTSAITSLGSLAGITPAVTASDRTAIDAADRSNRQHAWDRFEPTVASGNTLHPTNSLVLLLDYRSAGEPGWDDRSEVEAALAEIERNFLWSPNGILFTMAYSASYFDRYDEDPPEGAAPDPAETVVRTVAELTDLAETNDDVTPDEYDAALVLASNNPSNLLAAEEALWGGDAVVTFDATFEEIFEKPEGWPERRVGFAGDDFEDRTDAYGQRFLDDGQEIPDETPLSMGFVAGFGESIPQEDTVTLTEGQRFPNPDLDESAVPDLPYVGAVGERDPGVFAQGTLKHLAHLELDLPKWYGEDSDRRRHQMYSPYHDEAETNDEGGDRPGSGLVELSDDAVNEVAPDDDAYTVPEYAERTEATASGEIASGDVEPETDEPTVGHSQKVARARYDVDGDGEREQPVLRRDWDNVTPTGEDGADTAGYLFNVPMRFNESAYTVLDANYNVGFTSLDGHIDHDPVDDDAIAERNGIAPYMTATRRSNWLVPPITLRALPYPRAEEPTITIDRYGDTYVVAVRELDTDGGKLDPETVQFGPTTAVNQARGVAPDVDLQFGTTAIFTFDANRLDLSDDDAAKLFGKKRDSRKPVAATGRCRSSRKCDEE